MAYPTLNRRKIADRQYEITDGDTVVAVATQTGEPGRDTYPWEVLVVEGVDLGSRISPQATLKAAVDIVSSRRWAHKEKTSGAHAANITDLRFVADHFDNLFVHTGRGQYKTDAVNCRAAASLLEMHDSVGLDLRRLPDVLAFVQRTCQDMIGAVVI